MNELDIKDEVKIESMIYVIRGKQVILDSDLARLYECKNGTKSINLAVKRNLERFPERFMFQLSEDEFNNLRFQFETSSYKKENDHGGIRYLPFAFTEQGAIMLSAVLRTKVALEVSIKIIDAFVNMRKYISNNLIEKKYVNSMVFELDERVTLLENTFSKFDTISNEIFFEGQIYDAYSLLLDIFSLAKINITIIDNYISKNLLDVLSKTDKKVTIYTKNIDNNLINKYNSQYSNVTVKINNSFHDRFIIIDNSILYHSGASFKDLGRKCFAISKMDDKDILKQLKDKLK